MDYRLELNRFVPHDHALNQRLTERHRLGLRRRAL